MLNQIMSLLPFTIVNITQLEMGDHIFRFGAFHRQSFLTHHGIYMGDGHVIHFSGGAVNDTNTSNIFLYPYITINFMSVKNL